VIAEWGSYMGERMDAHFILKAVNSGGTVTQNYQGAYAKLDPTAAGNPLGLGAVDTVGPTYSLALDTSVVATGTFTNGSATIIAPLAVMRGASPIIPYTSVKIGIAPTTAEADGVRMGAYDLGVTSATVDHTSIMSAAVQASTEVRFGRLKIGNAFGSELQNLPVTISAMYYAVSPIGWVVNAGDSLTTTLTLDPYASNTTTDACYGTCTGTAAGSAGSVLLRRLAGTVPALAMAAAPTPTTAVPLVAGIGRVPLTATLAPGVLEFILVAPSWLKTNSGFGGTSGTYDNDPMGRVTFGVYGPQTNKSKFIYMRENY